jgi:GR25 family glycosyltransferase involved in LPS biosynthesis
MKGFYINLEHRTDRRQHIEKLIECTGLFSNIERMNACVGTRGDIACGMSHIKCLNQLSEFNEPYYIILEDDFMILNTDLYKEFEEAFDKIKDQEWDVIVLTPLGKDIQRNYYPNFHRICDTQTTTGYILKHHMVDEFKTIFRLGVSHLLQNHSPNLWSIDQVWKQIQHNKIFLFYNKCFAGQLPGYSDIEKRMVNYNRPFLDTHL